MSDKMDQETPVINIEEDENPSVLPATETTISEIGPKSFASEIATASNKISMAYNGPYTQRSTSAQLPPTVSSVENGNLTTLLKTQFQRKTRKRVFRPFEKRLMLQLLCSHPMVFLKSSTREANEEKQQSWNNILNEFKAHPSTTKEVTVKQLKKLYNNLGNPTFEQVQTCVHQMYPPSTSKFTNERSKVTTATIRPLQTPKTQERWAAKRPRVTQAAARNEPITAPQSREENITIQNREQQTVNSGERLSSTFRESNPGFNPTPSPQFQAPQKTQETEFRKEYNKLTIQQMTAEHEARVKLMNRQIECLNEEHAAKMKLIQMKTKLARQRLLGLQDIMNDDL